MDIENAPSGNLVKKNYDYMAMTYDGDGNCATVTYKKGGASGTTVAILTMTYDASGNCLTVTRT